MLKAWVGASAKRIRNRLGVEFEPKGKDKNAVWGLAQTHQGKIPFDLSASSVASLEDPQNMDIFGGVSLEIFFSSFNQARILFCSPKRWSAGWNFLALFPN